MNPPDILFVNPPLLNKKELTTADTEYRNTWSEWSRILFADTLREYSIQVPPNQEFLLDDEFAPVGLLMLARVAEDNGYTVDLCDFNQKYLSDTRIIGPSGLVTLDNMQEDYLREQLRPYTDPQIVAVTSLTHNINAALRILKCAKEIFPNSCTMIGGMHATFQSIELVKTYPYVDMVVKGPCGFNFADIVEAVLSKKNLENVGNITYRQGTAIEDHTICRTHIFSEEFILPHLKLLDEEFYGKAPIFSIFTQLGCSLGCTYCVDQLLYGNRVTEFTMDSIRHQMDNIFATFGRKIIQINDDTFTLNKKRCEPILEIMKEYDTIYQVQTRPEKVESSLLDEMKKSHVHFIYYGIENICEDILRTVHRRYHRSQVEKALTLTRDNGIVIGTFWIIGFPGETVTTIEENRKTLETWIGSGLTDLYELSVLVPFPGTQLYNHPETYGMTILTHDFNKYREDSPPVFRYDHLSAQDIYSHWMTTHTAATQSIRKRMEGTL